MCWEKEVNATKIQRKLLSLSAFKGSGKERAKSEGTFIIGL